MSCCYFHVLLLLSLKTQNINWMYKYNQSFGKSHPILLEDINDDGTNDVLFWKRMPQNSERSNRTFTLQILDGNTGQEIGAPTIDAPAAESTPRQLPRYIDVDNDGDFELVISYSSTWPNRMRIARIHDIPALKLQAEWRMETVSSFESTFDIIRQQAGHHILATTAQFRVQRNKPSRDHVFLIDHMGTELDRIQQSEGFVVNTVKSVDSNGDKSDEVIILNKRSDSIEKPAQFEVRAYDLDTDPGDFKSTEMWSNSYTAFECEILDTETDGHGASIILRVDGNMISLDAKSGRLLWKCEGPGHLPSESYTSAVLFNEDEKSNLPLILFRNGNNKSPSCRLPVRVDKNGRYLQERASFIMRP
ncbi:MAG: hypothetical protein CMJ78_21600 [Planctomycetaceae bacterium]|nr:hypothetical protein [Planctomycetaceae bacterium]